MLNLKSGDRVELFYEDAPATMVRATVDRLLTDRDEGMGIEVEDYVACWAEITVDEPSDGNATQVVLLGTDFKCRLNGRPVTLRKMQESTKVSEPRSLTRLQSGPVEVRLCSHRRHYGSATNADFPLVRPCRGASRQSIGGIGSRTTVGWDDSTFTPSGVAAGTSQFRNVTVLPAERTCQRRLLRCGAADRRPVGIRHGRCIGAWDPGRGDHDRDANSHSCRVAEQSR
jgi:hypothetical protein